MTKYYKLTNKDELHYGFQYSDGLNIDHLEFEWKGACCPGGLYFSDADTIINHIDIYSRYIREVTIPVDENQFLKDPSGDKWRSHSVICSSRKDLSDVNTWKWMLDNDIRITSNALIYASHHCWLDVVKLLLIDTVMMWTNHTYESAFIMTNNEEIRKLLSKGRKL